MDSSIEKVVSDILISVWNTDGACQHAHGDYMAMFNGLDDECAASAREACRLFSGLKEAMEAPTWDSIVLPWMSKQSTALVLGLGLLVPSYTRAVLQFIQVHVLPGSPIWVHAVMNTALMRVLKTQEHGLDHLPSWLQFGRAAYQASARYHRAKSADALVQTLWALGILCWGLPCYSAHVAKPTQQLDPPTTIESCVFKRDVNSVRCLLERLLEVRHPILRSMLPDLVRGTEWQRWATRKEPSSFRRREYDEPVIS